MKKEELRLECAKLSLQVAILTEQEASVDSVMNEAEDIYKFIVEDKHENK